MPGNRGRSVSVGFASKHLPAFVCVVLSREAILPAGNFSDPVRGDRSLGRGPVPDGRTGQGADPDRRIWFALVRCLHGVPRRTRSAQTKSTPTYFLLLA